jgi:uncharacterized repeat protein (TIGR01451 family)
MKNFFKHIASLLFAGLLAAVLSNSVVAQTPVGTHIDNIGTLHFDYLNGSHDSTKSNIVSTVVEGTGKMSLVKTVSQAIALPGDTVLFRIIMTNTGTSSFGGASILDTLPSAFLLLSSNHGAINGDSIISWTNIELGVNASDTLIITAQVRLSTPYNSVLTNYGYGIDSTGTVLRDSATVTISNPKVFITLDISRDTITVGDPFYYTIRWGNNGNITLHNVVMQDTLPASLLLDTLLQKPTTVNGNSKTVAKTLGVSFSGNIVTVTLDSMRVGQTDSVIVPVITVPTLPNDTKIPDVAWIHSFETPTQAKAVGKNIVVLARQTAMILTKSVSKDTITVGDTVSYTIQISNAGDFQLTNIAVTDTLPLQLTNFSVSSNAHLSGSIVTYTNAVLAVGASDVITVKAIVPTNRLKGEIILNTAYAQSSEIRSRIAQASFVVSAHASVAITKTASKDTVSFGQSMTYKILVRNTGDTPLRSVAVSDTVNNSAFTILSVSKGSFTNNVVAYTRDSLAVGQSDSVLINVQVKSAASGITISNTSYVRSSSTALQSAQALVRLMNNLSMTLTKTVSKDTVATGDTVRYVIRITNPNVQTLTHVTIADTLPVQLNNATVSGNAQLNGKVVAASFSSLNSGATDSIVVNGTVTVSNFTHETVLNRVHAHSDQGPDQTAQAVSYSKVVPVSQLTLTKKATKNTVFAGDSLGFTVYVHNSGNTLLTHVAVQDTIPFQLTNAVVSSNARLIGKVVEYSKDSLQAGVQDSILILAVVMPNRPNNESILNTAYGKSDQTTQQIAQALSTVVPRVPVNSNLQLWKTVSKDTVLIGDTLQYALRVKNTGTHTLTHVALSDTLPFQLFNSEVSSNARINGKVVTFMKDSLRGGESDSVVITSRLSTDVPNHEMILNRVFAQSDSTPEQTADVIFITQDDPACVIKITATPNKVIANGRQASVIWAYLSNTLGNPKPDGTPVYFTTTVGTFSNGLSSSIGYTKHGVAVDSLRATIATSGTIATALAIASAHNNEGCHAADTVQIVFFPGAIEGTVVDQKTSKPVKGALVRAYSLSADTLVGSDITEDDGKYLIPIAKTDSFHVTITTTNSFGFQTTVNTDVQVTVSGGGDPPVSNKNSISGAVYYLISGLPVPAAGIQIDLTPVSSSNSVKQNGKAITNSVMTASTTTDSSGAYKFDDVPAGTYRASVNYGKIEGSVNVTNDGNGTYVINANIPIVLNPNLVFSKSGPARTTKVDTVTYTLSVKNTGTLPTTNTKVIDSLDQAMRFVSAGSGGVYEAAGHDVVWTIGTLDSGTSRTYVLRVTFADTIQNTILLHNHGELSSNETNPIDTTVNTLVQLPPKMRIWKTSSVHTANVGDTVTYLIHVTNTAGSRADSVEISDNLPNELSYLSSVVNYYHNGQSTLQLNGSDFDSLTHTLTWKCDSLGVGDSLLMVLNTIVRSDLAPGEYSYVNLATLTWPQGTSSSGQDSSSNAGVHTVVSYLKITKQAVRKVLEIGDIATYIVKVTNISTTSYARKIAVVDKIPFGFGYLSGSSFGDSTKIANPVQTRSSDNKKELIWNLTDSLPPQATMQIVYRLAVGAGANEGNGINTAQAFGTTPFGVGISSAPVNEQVEVQLGVFSTHGLVIGKVFYDDNHNAYQDSGEVGVKGVELMLENGTRVVTGDDGKYSIPDLEPGDHVIKVRAFTLPKHSALITGHDEFAGDAGSRFVHLTESGIARVDFYLKHLIPPTPDTIQLKQTIAKAGEITVRRIADPRNVVFIEDARIAPMKLTGLQFEVGKAALRPEAYPTLKQLASILRDYPHQTVLIVGHTDAMKIHTKEFPSNKELSIARANAAKTYLVKEEQIAASRITTQGFGETKPVATNKTAEGRALNRRVEFFFGNETEPPKLSSTQVVFRIPIDYEGAVPLQKLEVRDVLDTTFHYVDSSAQLGNATIATRVDGQNLYWTIDSIGKSFHKTIVYQAVVNEPAASRLVIAHSYTSFKCFAGDTVGLKADSLTTTNEIAVAVRGKAINYVMSGVLFDVAKATLRSSASTALQVAAEVMKSDPNATAVIEGHTDSNPIHTFEFPSNLELSQARANTIVDALVKEFGISRDRFRSIGYGPLRPVAPNATESGRQANRRVEIQIFRKDFVDSTIPPGLVDSSALAHRRFIPKVGIHSFDSSAIGYIGDQFMFKLEVHKKITAKTLTTTLIDTLPAGIEMLPNTLTAVRGIDTLYVNSNIITAVCSPNDTLSMLTFLTEVTREMKVEHSAASDTVSTEGNQFTVVRVERYGKTVYDTTKPILMEIRRAKNKNELEAAKASDKN